MRKSPEGGVPYKPARIIGDSSVGNGKDFLKPQNKVEEKRNSALT